MSSASRLPRCSRLPGSCCCWEELQPASVGLQLRANPDVSSLSLSSFSPAAPGPGVPECLLFAAAAVALLAAAWLRLLLAAGLRRSGKMRLSSTPARDCRGLRLGSVTKRLVRVIGHLRRSVWHHLLPRVQVCHPVKWAGSWLTRAAVQLA
jgi:hypothetical protein